MFELILSPFNVIAVSESGYLFSSWTPKLIICLTSKHKKIHKKENAMLNQPF